MREALYIALRLIKSREIKANISTPAINIGSIAVGLSICIMILSVAVISGFKHEIIYKVKRLTSDVVIMAYQNSKDITSHPLYVSEDTLRLIKGISIIKDVQPTCVKNSILKIKEENEGVVFKGVTSKYNWELLKPYLIEGEFPTYTDTSLDKRVVISKKLADKMQIYLHQKIIVYFINKIIDSETGEEKLDYRSRDLYVSGIIHLQMGELDNQLLYGDAKIIQKVNNWGDSLVSGYEIFLKDFDKLVENSRELENLLPYDLSQQPVTAKHFDTFEWLELLDNNVVIILVIILAVTAFNIISVLLIMMMERTNMIGILKALGAENKQIERIFLLHAWHIVARGFLWGNLVAYLLYLLEYYGKFIPLDTQNYLVSYVPVQWDWLTWLLANAGTFLLISFVMWLPIRFVVKIPPVKAIRFV